MYADTITGSMKAAISETNRRRKIQKKYNDEHGITPKTIKKGISDLIQIGTSDKSRAKGKTATQKTESREAQIERLRREMKEAASNLRFEEAAFLRDKIRALETTKASPKKK